MKTSPAIFPISSQHRGDPSSCETFVRKKTFAENPTNPPAEVLLRKKQSARPLIGSGTCHWMILKIIICECPPAAPAPSKGREIFHKLIIIGKSNTFRGKYSHLPRIHQRNPRFSRLRPLFVPIMSVKLCIMMFFDKTERKNMTFFDKTETNITIFSEKTERYEATCAC
ncbi:MAG: hypothetical protein E7105_07490 [Prevotella sp.]|nr:hypothetical protein [Prevotella sp.]